MVSYKGGFGKCTLVPVFSTGEHLNVPSSRLSVQWNIRMYPCSGLWYKGTSLDSAETSRTLQKVRSIVSGKGAESLRKFRGNFAENFAENPFW